MAIGKVADGRQGARARDEELDALLHRCALRQETQGICEPPLGARGCQACGFLARLAQEGHGGEIALARRALDVVCALRRRCAPRGKRVGAPLVRTEPPAGGGGLVDRPAHERMPKAEAAGTSVVRRRSSCRSSSIASITEASGIPVAAAASSGSKGSPATDAPSRTRRADSDSSASSPVIEAATVDGTPIAASHVSSWTAAAPSARSSDRASCSQIERVAAALLVEGGCVSAVDRVAQ